MHNFHNNSKIMYDFHFGSRQQYSTSPRKNFFICSNSPILNGRLLFWGDSFCPFVSSWNLLFSDDPALNVTFLWILQFNHIFYKLSVKTLAVSNKIRCLHCFGLSSSSWAVDSCQLKNRLFCLKWKKHQEQVWGSIQFLSFKP